MYTQSIATGTAGAAVPMTRIAIPRAGARTVIDNAAGGALALEFNPCDAALDCCGDDLTFTLRDGGSVSVRGYFAAADGTLPDFVLPDGTVSTAMDIQIDRVNTPIGGPQRTAGALPSFAVVVTVAAGGADAAFALRAAHPRGGEDPDMVLRTGKDHDLLILKAENARRFGAVHRAWLESLSDPQLAAMPVEDIWINAKGDAGWMRDPAAGWFRDLVARYNGLTGKNIRPEVYFAADAAGISALSLFLLESGALDVGEIIAMQRCFGGPAQTRHPDGVFFSFPSRSAGRCGGTFATLRH